MRLVPEEIQNEYYTKNANTYDQFHDGFSKDVDHNFNLSFLSSIIEYYNIVSVLDVGAGTGRAIAYLKLRHPNLKIIGIEPIAELRQRGYDKGIDKSVLIDGNGTELQFSNEEFDLVCEFGVLHHVAKPDRMVEEMLRVATKAIFISDSNNFGQGKPWIRALKQLINYLKLWDIFIYVKTRGRKFQVSDGDGIYYSYSIFNSLGLIRKKCKHISLLSFRNQGANLYRSASNLAVLGIK